MRSALPPFSSDFQPSNKVLGFNDHALSPTQGDIAKFLYTAQQLVYLMLHILQP